MSGLKGMLYDVVMAPLERLGLARRRERLLTRLENPVLEVGVGTGLNLPRYPDGHTVIAVDPQLALLRRARGRRRVGQQLVCARAEALPFRDRCFRTVAGSFVFCTVADPLRGLEEVRRVLVPDGELRLFEHVRWRRYPRVARAQDALTPLWRVVADGCHLNRDIETLVKRAGLEMRERREAMDGLLVEMSARRPT